MINRKYIRIMSILSLAVVFFLNVSLCAGYIDPGYGFEISYGKYDKKEKITATYPSNYDYYRRTYSDTLKRYPGIGCLPFYPSIYYDIDTYLLYDRNGCLGSYSYRFPYSYDDRTGDYDIPDYGGIIAGTSVANDQNGQHVPLMGGITREIADSQVWTIKYKGSRPIPKYVYLYLCYNQTVDMMVEFVTPVPTTENQDDYVNTNRSIFNEKLTHLSADVNFVNPFGESSTYNVDKYVPSADFFTRYWWGGILGDYGYNNDIVHYYLGYGNGYILKNKIMCIPINNGQATLKFKNHIIVHGSNYIRWDDKFALHSDAIADGGADFSRGAILPPGGVNISVGSMSVPYVDEEVSCPISASCNILSRLRGYIQDDSIKLTPHYSFSIDQIQYSESGKDDTFQAVSDGTTVTITGDPDDTSGKATVKATFKSEGYYRAHIKTTVNIDGIDGSFTNDDDSGWIHN